MVPTTPLRKSLMSDFIDRLFTEMHITWSSDVTLVNVKEKSHKGMKCHKMPSKFVRSLTFGASILWDLVVDIQEKDKNRSQNDKTENEKGKSVKRIGKERASKSNQVIVNPRKWNWKEHRKSNPKT
ncbi:hypothetical protein Tco_0101618 [Tanacetum coccineum]